MGRDLPRLDGRADGRVDLGGERVFLARSRLMESWVIADGTLKIAILGTVF
jgi:hypothetical protein